MIINDFMYRKYLSSDFIPFDEESKLLPVRLKSPYISEDECFDFSENKWVPFSSSRQEDYAAEFVELPVMPKKFSNPQNCYDDSEDLDSEEMAQFLSLRYWSKRCHFNKRNFYDRNNIEKDYVKAKITTDTDALTLKITFTKFARDEKAEPHYETEVPVFEEKSLFFDMKNGAVNLDSLPKYELEDRRDLCTRIQDALPYSVIEKAFERLLELAEQFTGVSFDQYREQLKTKKIALYEFYKITMLPMCPDLYDIINDEEIKNRHVHFRYKRTDSKIFKRFCRKYRIRNTKVLRKTFLERPEVLITFLHLKDAGFRDMNLYNRVITNKEEARKIDGVNQRSLAFFCQYSIKKRGQKATMNTILRKTSDFEDLNDYLYDGLDMFSRYFKHIPETLKTDILTDGFTQFNHDALANTAYRYENKNITFTYTDEQKKLEDDIDGYCFRLPENSYELCEIGTSLHNCVATYSSSVKDKACTIVYATKDDKYEICIEVRKNEVWQQRMDHNKNPDKEQQEVLSKWRTRHNLQLR